MRNFHKLLVTLMFCILTMVSNAATILIPMDKAQTNHCRVYGLIFRALQKECPGIAWLLNYRGGSFITPDLPEIKNQAGDLGIYIESLSDNDLNALFDMIADEDMDVVPLELAPKIAIYLSSAGENDVVAWVLNYAGISFETIYDEEILQGGLKKYDWLHIHHRDFTGQAHKRGRSALVDVQAAQKTGYSKVWQMKHAVADSIREFVSAGGFLFAMCSAAETFDIALAAHGTDIVPAFYDGDPVDPNAQSKIDFERSFAFTGFTVFSDFHKYSDIDVPSAGHSVNFSLFQFAAKVDAIPCLLNQNHEQIIRGFSGETSSFRKSLVKRNVTILAENSDGVSVRYLMGTHGSGIFSYYGGHTPGSAQNDFISRASAFRLILNNVLFPSAKVKKRKT